MSEIKNGTLGLYGTEYLRCNYMMTLGFKGLMLVGVPVFGLYFLLSLVGDMMAQ